MKCAKSEHKSTDAQHIHTEKSQVSEKKESVRKFLKTKIHLYKSKSLRIIIKKGEKDEENGIKEGLICVCVFCAATAAACISLIVFGTHISDKCFENNSFPLSDCLSSDRPPPLARIALLYMHCGAICLGVCVASQNHRIKVRLMIEEKE